MVGFAQHFAWAGQGKTAADVIYAALQLFVLENSSGAAPIPWTLEIARFLAPAVAVYTASQALAVIFRDQLEALRISRQRDHVVICGLGTKGFLLASSLRQRGDRVVVVERDRTNDRLAGCREFGVLALVGNATDDAVLSRVRLNRARCLVAVCGDDGANAEIALRARAAAGARPTPLTRSEEHTSELQSQSNLVCRLLLEKKKQEKNQTRQ